MFSRAGRHLARRASQSRSGAWRSTRLHSATNNNARFYVSSSVLPNFNTSTSINTQSRFLSEAATATESTSETGSGGERLEFQAETRMLLDIVAKSLYSHKEVFIRELISNASDALEKLRYLQTTEPDRLTESIRQRALEISINCDPKAKTITFQDSGIGMTRQDLIENLGTIARSGSKAFIEELNKQKSSSDSMDAVIGRFGVGFYSTFMVAHRVDVYTRAAQPDAKTYKWTSDGSGFYEISDIPDADLESGTKIVVHLNEDELKYAEKGEVQRVIREYSYFVNSAIYVNGERANTQEALWVKRPSECKKEDYDAFFKCITYGGTERPMYTLHYQTDVPLSINALLFVPDRKPNHLMAMNLDTEVGVELYSRRVLIQRHAKGVLPKWLRFLTGVIDSEDIPLNLSRELLQKGIILDRLKNAITTKVVSFFESQMKKDRVTYQKFYDDFGVFFKEAILGQVDQTAHADIAKLLLFDSSNCRPGVRTSLQEYVDRMQDKQKSIYYLHVPTREMAEHSPFYEAFRHTGMETLFVTDPADELMLFYLQKFSEVPIVSAENWFKSQTDTSDKSDRSTYKDLMQFMELTLGGKRVKSVELCRRPIEQPCLITTAENESVLRSFQRFMDKSATEEQKIMLMQPKLEINPKHPIVRRLNKIRRDDKELAELLTEQLWTNAMIQAGLIVDSRKTVTKLNELLTRLLDRHETESGIITPR